MSISLQQVGEHNSTQSCWVIIKNKVYDVTEFLSEHPGGAKIILKYAGRDATSAYEPIHPPDALDKNLPAEKHLGDLDNDSVVQLEISRGNRQKTAEDERMELAQAKKPSISRILNLYEMEDVAKSLLSNKAWAYYSSATDEETARVENARAFSRFFFNARSSIPVFVSGAALAKLGHPLGEANITKGAGFSNLIQMVSSNASLSYAQIAEARLNPSQPLFFQLYKHKDDKVAEARVREIEQLGYKAIFLTADAIVPGNRERDVRAGWDLDKVEDIAEGKSKADLPRKRDDMAELESSIDIKGTAGALIANDDINMTWKKGIQCVDDALLAAEAGCDGILLSNHGGRQLEYSMPPIEVLYKLRKHHPEVFTKLEVYLDGGVRRGTDILKALCLGATAVGMGRPFLYAQSAYGAAGVVKIIRILEREIIMGMQLIGAKTVKDLVPDMVERVDWQPITARL
ncbi:hypothetical protein EUX98_g7598 [Antrodiella citrinella]|uniref:Cytochrome b5 heme-binding domain-containing protein n=1 Tax=Antrodiella citrinella TaxID=2447956 RepID=A0A4S4ML52_9APHY|nr:hypothetical protein EUX98_g7598 [Antrodiella citrinella]